MNKPFLTPEQREMINRSFPPDDVTKNLMTKHGGFRSRVVNTDPRCGRSRRQLRRIAKAIGGAK